MDDNSVYVVRADYLAVMALKTGRAKDMARILSLLEVNAVTEDQIANVATKHNLEKE